MCLAVCCGCLGVQVSMYDEKEGPLVFGKGPVPRVFFDITIGGRAAGRIEMTVRFSFPVLF